MSVTELASQAIEVIAGELNTFYGLLAYAGATIGAALVVGGSFVKTMIPLRWLAVGGNVGFAVFGALHPSFPTLVIALALLPINVYRAIEMVRLTRRVRESAQAGDLSGIWLQPYMKRSHLKDGHVLFRKGDPGDKLYFLAVGRILLVEIGEYLEPGKMFGEIAFFAPDGRRTLSAQCVGSCTVLSLDGERFRQLYYQNPSFGFQLVGLVANRLMADTRRLQRDRAAPDPAPASQPVPPSQPPAAAQTPRVASGSGPWPAGKIDLR